jgi:hypothetical protein
MELAEAVVSEYKLDLVCADEVADALIGAIAKAAHTGQPEAGWIFVSEVTHADRNSLKACTTCSFPKLHPQADRMTTSWVFRTMA